MENNKWVWCLNFDNKTVHPARIIRAKCSECGKKNEFTPAYNFSMNIPFGILDEDAIIYVPRRDYVSRSRLSYEMGGGFFRKKRYLEFLNVPKKMQYNIMTPDYHAITCYDSFELLYTYHPIPEDDYIIKKETICFECLRKTLGKADYRQGNLAIWKVSDKKENASSIFHYKVMILGKYCKDLKIFNHHIPAEGYIRDETKITFTNHSDITITAEDHEDLTIPPGVYIGYHPRPQPGRGLD